MPETEEKKLPFDEKITVEKWKFVSPEEYKSKHKETIKESFWLSIASELDWFKKPQKAYEGKFPFLKWFPDGKINASYLCLDVQIKKGKKDKIALLWIGEDKKERTLTYNDFFKLVNSLSFAFKNRLGLKKGDIATIYMPMIPELPATMLALSRIGVIFSVVFSGFGSQALKDRIDDSGSKIIITADGFLRRGKKIYLQKNVESATSNSNIEKTVVFRRLGEGWLKDKKDIFADDLIKDVPSDVFVEPEEMNSYDPLFILYTSGTTGKPKGIVRDTGGYLTILWATMKWVFDIKDEDIFWCTADIGWITGHSYIVFGPMMVGATQVMYEGTPDYPHPGIWWEIIEKYKVSIFYTSPTAIRLLMKYPEENVEKYNLDSLRILHSVGEPINPEAWRWFFNRIGKRKCIAGSTWWMTETGGIIISHTPGWELIPMKPGTNGMPIPGVSVSVRRQDGSYAEPGEKGFLVIDNPFPGMPLTIWKDDRRYEETYWKRFEGVFYTGDFAVQDQDGYIWVLGRADEVIKTAGHRLGTYEIESALTGYEGVAESAVVGIEDKEKGEIPIAFVILKEGVSPSDTLKEKLKEQVRKVVGPIAVPKDIVFISKLPKTRSGKIMRRLLKAVFTEAKIGDITTLEDEASIEEIEKAYRELKKELGK